MALRMLNWHKLIRKKEKVWIAFWCCFRLFFCECSFRFKNLFKDRPKHKTNRGLMNEWSEQRTRSPKRQDSLTSLIAVLSGRLLLVFRLFSLHNLFASAFNSSLVIFCAVSHNNERRGLSCLSAKSFWANAFFASRLFPTIFILLASVSFSFLLRRSSMNNDNHYATISELDQRRGRARWRLCSGKCET